MMPETVFWAWFFFWAVVVDVLFSVYFRSQGDRGWSIVFLLAGVFMAYCFWNTVF